MARKITEDAVAAFLAPTPYDFNRDNTSVHVVADEFALFAVMRLHGNTIATRSGDTVTLTDAGWRTVTTRERLNGILDFLGLDRIVQRKSVWVQDGRLWDGTLTVRIGN